MERKRNSLRNIIGIVLATVLILMVPLLAMQFTDEVSWTVIDVVTAGALLAGTGLLYELAARKVSGTRYTVAIGLAFGAALLLVWAELAVGIFGTPFSGT